MVLDKPDYKNVADIELWQFCRQDDVRAYDELFRRYYPRALRLVSNYIKDTMRAEEICMDQLFNLWAKRMQITINGDFSNYLFRCVRNSVISHIRKEIPVTIGLEEIKDEYQTSRSSDYRLLSQEVKQAYFTALKKLSPRRRQVFVLSRHKKLTYPEIAKKLNLSENTIENYMVAALDGLRTNMKGYLLTLLISLFFLYDFIFVF